MICSSDGFTNLVFTNPKFLFVIIFFGFSVRIIYPNTQQISEANSGFVKTRFVKPSDEQIISETKLYFQNDIFACFDNLN